MYLMFGSLALCLRLLLGTLALWVLVPLCCTSPRITTQLLCGLVSLAALETVLNGLKDVFGVLGEGLDVLRNLGKRALLQPPAFLYVLWLAIASSTGYAWYREAHGTQGALLLAGCAVTVAGAVVSLRCFLRERAGTSFIAYCLWASQLAGLAMLANVAAGVGQAWAGFGLLAGTTVSAEVILQVVIRYRQRKDQQAA